MRAMTYEAPYKIKVRHKPDPIIEHPLDAVLKVTRTAICGSDLHLLHGLVPDTRVGHTFGHEFTGVVEEVGRGVENLEVGDRVAVPFPIACGGCFFCQRGLFANCENANPASDVATGVFGYSHTTGGYDGGQAQYVRVPYANVGPMKIPDDMSDEEVLFLTDILPTGYQGAEMAEISPGDTVVVFGCGPVGLFAMRSAWLMGAGRVIAVDHVPYRLAFAEKYARVETLNFKEVDVITAIKEMTEGRGADASIDAVGLEAAGGPLQQLLGVKMKLQGGSSAALNFCFHATRKGGRVSVVGVYGPPMLAMDFGTAMNKGLTIRTNQCSVHRYMPHLMQLIRNGTIDAKGIITHRFGLDDIAHAYEIFSDKKDDCIKCVIDPHATIH
jgi:threonine dehydrogenase-like Zn-dependent dehydrogenase